MKEDFSGTTLFFRYAFACVERRLLQGTLAEDLHRSLLQIHAGIETDEVKILEILRTAFPSAYEKIIRHGETMRLNPFSLKNVRDYWRNHHNQPEEPSPVFRLRVRSKITTPQGSVFYILDDCKMPKYTNPYNLNIKEDSLVFTHANSIIEIA